MHKFIADLENNRFYMHIEGFYSKEKLEQAVTSAMLEAEKLEPGYTVINNIASLYIADVDGLRHIKNLMKFAHERGTKKVIRVVDNQLSKLQFGDITAHAAYEVVEVGSMEEAEKYLQENGL